MGAAYALPFQNGGGSYAYCILYAYDSDILFQGGLTMRFIILYALIYTALRGAVRAFVGY